MSRRPPPPDPVGGEQPAARHPCDGGGGSASTVAPSLSGVDVFSCVLEFDMDSFIAIREGLKRDRSHMRWNFFRLNRILLFFHVDKLNRTFFSCFLRYEKDAMTKKKGVMDEKIRGVKRCDDWKNTNLLRFIYG